MSAFGFYEKDNLVDAIELLANRERERGKTPKQVIESIVEAMTCGISSALYEMRDEKVDLVRECHNASRESGWWNDLHTGEPLELTQERVGDKMMLIVTEIAEAKEGQEDMSQGPNVC
jgi:hypothetical protein